MKQVDICKIDMYINIFYGCRDSKNKKQKNKLREHTHQNLKDEVYVS